MQRTPILITLVVMSLLHPNVVGAQSGPPDAARDSAEAIVADQAEKVPVPDLRKSAKKRASSVERTRPAEWAGLVRGGRFMDLFEPMPDLGGMTSDTWGVEGVVPRDVNNGIEDPKWSYWGGNTLQVDGKYHLFVCRWPENDPRGHFAYPDSVIVHAVCDRPYGPFRVVREIGVGHNPTCYQTDNGPFVLYHTTGCYIADSIDGPWTASKLTYDSRDRPNTKSVNYLHNNTFAKREDGSFFMLNRKGQAWFSKDGISPFFRVTEGIVYPPADGRYEDPVVWRDEVQYHLIVNDWQGRIAWYQRSKDGVNWTVEPGEAYQPGIAVHASGVKEDWYKYERIRILQDDHGRAIAANFAVIDFDKRGDLPNDSHSSKLIVSPLTVPRRLTVLGEISVIGNTDSIRMRIHAESGFDPHSDVDVQSLRFGASDEVNFGRGCRAVKFEEDGDDLIVTFAGDSGFTVENFVGKLLGKTTEGELMFGWSRLPGVHYIESILSARAPVFHDNTASVKIENFGQVASPVAKVTLLVRGNVVASETVPALDPFGEAIVRLQVAGERPRRGDEVTVRIERNEVELSSFALPQ